jgi:O-antigen/teichoic acid export membrane protein
MLKNVVASSSGNVVFLVAQMVRNVLMANFLGPLHFGAWNLGLVLLQYAQPSHGGILNALRLDGARCRGEGRLDKYADLRRQTWTVTMSTALLVTLGATAATVFLDDLNVRLAVWVLALTFLPLQLYQFAGSCLTLEERFTNFARLQGWFSGLNLMLTVALGLPWGFPGVLAAQVIAYVGALFYIRHSTPLYFRPFLNTDLLIEQLKLGFPLWLNTMLYVLFVAIDRTVIAGVLGVAALGQYSLTALARTSIGLIPSSVSEVIYMRASTQFGATGRRQPPLQLALRANQLIAYLSALPIGFAILWTPSLIRQFLPSFDPGVQALQIFLLGLFFMFPSHGSTLLTVIGRAGQASFILGLSVFLEAGLVLFGARVAGLEGVAAATAAASAFYFAAINWSGLRPFVGGFAALKHTWVCALPWMALTSGLGLAILLTTTQGLRMSSLSGSLLSSLLIVAVLSPVVFFGVRHLPSGTLQS